MLFFVVGVMLPPVDPPSEVASRQTSPSATPSQEDTPAPSPTPTVPDGVPRDAQQATVREVIDGDTVKLAVKESGKVLASTSDVSVQLLETDSPETKRPSKPAQCYGKAATKRLRELIPPSSTIWIQQDKELRDQRGRYLLYVWTDDADFVNLTMVREGFARGDSYPQNDKHWDVIGNAENKARKANRGLWGSCDRFGQPVGEPEPKPEPDPEPKPEPEPEPEPEKNCAPGYSPCVPPYPPDVDCGDVVGPITVTGSDPHGLDADGDGVACE